MSITFSPEFRVSDITGWNVTHYADGGIRVVSGPHADYDEAELALLEHDARCRDGDGGACDGMIGEVPASEMTGAPKVNVANDNAILLLRAMGFLTDESTAEDLWTGPCSCPAEDFLGRALTADALSPADEGVPVCDATQPGGPRWTEWGRRPGYLHACLAELRGLAEFCRVRGRLVTWG